MKKVRLTVKLKRSENFFALMQEIHDAQTHQQAKQRQAAAQSQ